MSLSEHDEAPQKVMGPIPKPPASAMRYELGRLRTMGTSNVVDYAVHRSAPYCD